MSVYPMTDIPLLLNFFTSFFTKEKLIGLLLSLPIVVISLSFHEAAHGYVAYTLGDPTAKNLGRISMNPLKHLDPIGTICMIFFHFGWAKPVPINTRYFQKPKRDMAISSAAGPVSNFILSLLGLLFYAVTLELLYIFPSDVMYLITLFFNMFYYMNLYLAIFNLIPIPPLDGSRLAFIFLPDKFYWGVMKYERVIIIVMMVLLYTGIVTVPLEIVAGFTMKGLEFMLGLLPFFPHL